MHSNWAIVIGIERYPELRKSELKGCVHDAIRMAEWLLDPAGGNVSASHMIFLAEPSPDPLPRQLLTVETISPTYANVVRAVNLIVTKSGTRGDRLFVYFSGHGFTYREGKDYHEALVLQDYSGAFPNNSMAVDSLVGYLSATQISNQFYFLDSCRNLEFDNTAEVGKMPKSPSRPADQLPVQSFVFYGTQPGVAANIVNALEPYSVFTRQLLEGLHGAGRAKVWNPISKKYLIRVTQLFNYLKSSMERLNEAVAKDRVQLPQLKPTIGSPSLDPDPVVTEFERERVGPEPWSILVDPAHVFPSVRFEYRSGFGLPTSVPTPPEPPLILRLPPQIYLLAASTSASE